MIYNITHTNNYYYSNNVSLCHNLAHLTARNCPWQTCLQQRAADQHPAGGLDRPGPTTSATS